MLLLRLIRLEIIFGVIFALGMISLVGVAYQESQAIEPVIEIDQNQVEDEVSITIRIQLEDGISSSDDLR